MVKAVVFTLSLVLKKKLEENEIEVALIAKGIGTLQHGVRTVHLKENNIFWCFFKFVNYANGGLFFCY